MLVVGVVPPQLDAGLFEKGSGGVITALGQYPFGSGMESTTDTLYDRLYTTVDTPVWMILTVHLRQGHLWRM